MNHKLTLTEDQWDFLLLILATEHSVYSTGLTVADRNVGRKLSSILTKLRKYKHDTNQ
jgi:hypothetical protein